jgi:hypothetical protein
MREGQGQVMGSGLPPTLHSRQFITQRRIACTAATFSSLLLPLLKAVLYSMVAEHSVKPQGLLAWMHRLLELCFVCQQACLLVMVINISIQDSTSLHKCLHSEL